MSIVIVDYHKGNLLSVERGLVGAGADVVVTDKADVIRAADAVVLPGVGAFADAAASMEEMTRWRRCAWRWPAVRRFWASA